MTPFDVQIAEQDENNAFNAAEEQQQILDSQADDDYDILMSEQRYEKEYYLDHPEYYNLADAAEFDAMMARNRYASLLQECGITAEEHEQQVCDILDMLD